MFYSVYFKKIKARHTEKQQRNLYNKGVKIMFDSLSTFSIFFFTVSAILLIGIIFEEKFLALEDKFDTWLEKRKQQKHNTNRATHEKIR